MTAPDRASAPPARLRDGVRVWMRVAVLVAAGGASSVSAQAPADSGAFVVRLGGDTVAVERYVRRGDRLEGEQVVRDPVTSLRRYTAELRPDGSVRRFTIRLHTVGLPNGGTPYTFAYDFAADSAWMRYDRPGLPPGDVTFETKRHLTRRPAVPMLRYSPVLNQLALSRMRRAGVDTVVLLPVAADDVVPMVVRRAGDSLVVDTGEGPNVARLDARGRLVRWDGTRTLTKVTAEPVPWAAADVPRLADGFARRDREGRGLGRLSPRDSVSAAFGGARVSVGYGRPSMRGRTIFGGIIPWGRVWRTGANITTQLTTDRDLVIGGAAVPAGTYSLYTIPEPGRWTLIVNRATGESGREDTYDPAQDVVRVPMQFRALDAPVETLALTLAPEGDGAVLRVAWERTEAWVPVRVR